jgi:hypothetical protein
MQNNKEQNSNKYFIMIDVTCKTYLKIQTKTLNSYF